MTTLAIESFRGLPLLVVKGERSEVYTMNVNLAPAPIFAVTYREYCAQVDARRDQAIKDAIQRAVQQVWNQGRGQS